MPAKLSSFRAIGRAIRHFQCVLIYELTIEVTPGVAVCVYIPVSADKLPRTERANH